MNQWLPTEPSPEMLDYLKEEMRLRFPLVQDRSPDLITTRLDQGKVVVDVWSTTGRWIMSAEDSLEKVNELEEAFRKDPQYRADKLAFLTEIVASQLALQRSRKRFWSW